MLECFIISRRPKNVCRCRYFQIDITWRIWFGGWGRIVTGFSKSTIFGCKFNVITLWSLLEVFYSVTPRYLIATYLWQRKNADKLINYIIAGKLNNVEPITMNLSLSDATFIGTDEIECQFDSFYVQGKNVRFVQVPDEVDMLQTIKT